MKDPRIVASLVACIGAVTLGACGSAQLPVDGNPASGLAMSSVSQGDANASVITFNPPSPLKLPLNTSVQVKVSEAGYSGGFAVVGCSAKRPIHCTWIKYGMACYENYTPNQINSIEAKIYPGQKIMTMANAASGTYFPKIICRFTIRDSNGHPAVYSASSP